MKLMPVRRFLAQKWTWPIAFFGGYLAMAIIFSLVLLDHGKGFVISLILGTFSGVIANHMICHTLFCLCTYANGTPYKIGDTLLILSGKHRNKTVRVYEMWKERNQLRVDLGEDAKASLEDIFSFNEVCKVEDDMTNAKSL